MTIKDLAPCTCDKSCIEVEELILPSGSRDIMAIYDVRIVCRNCGYKTPYGGDFDAVASFWNKTMKGK